MQGYMHYTRKAAFCMVLGIIASVLPFFFVYQIIRPIVNGIMPEIPRAAFWCFLSLLCMILYAVLYVRGLEYSHISAYHTLKNIRAALQKKLEQQPLGTIQAYGNGRLKKVFTDDIEMIELLLAHAIPEGIANLCVPAVIIIAMFFVDWKLALLSLCGLPLGMLAMGMMMKAGLDKMDAYYKAGAVMNNTIIEYINGMEVVKVFNRDGESYERLVKDVDNYRDFTLDWYKVCWPWMALYLSILPCIALFTLPIGGYLVLRGFSTLQDLVLILCMSFSVGAPLLKAMSFAGKFPQLSYKIDELERLMDHAPLQQTADAFSGTDHSIRYEHVSFSYEESEVLHDISLNIGEGQMVALVGESGSGKSTLARLLVHFYDLDSGKISLGGQALTQMSVEALNNEISYVAQEQFLFNMSLYDNILIGKPDATREEVLQAATRAQCDEFLTRLPKGIDTMARDSGKMLSGGERQRIALARALLKNAPVIVLDEATAFIDPENEEKMNAAIAEVIRDKTVLVIAHRLHTITGADKICVLKEGRLEGEGTHEELLKTSVEYQKLWSAALKAADWTIRKEVRV
ncbi:MAG: ABC transporter ATP-binding protein [Lachnospiraceae bacterium]|nr:ABC transporter ATP-binding protein [Lachnospiraceae bacterium]